MRIILRIDELRVPALLTATGFTVDSRPGSTSQITLEFTAPSGLAKELIHRLSEDYREIEFDPVDRGRVKLTSLRAERDWEDLLRGEE